MVPLPQPLRFRGAGVDPVMARRLAVILSSFVLAGCGAAPASLGPVASTSPEVSVTEAANARTVSVAVGDRLGVSLHQQPGYAPWQQPASSDTGVLQPLPASIGTPVEGITLAAFKAVRAGHADITAIASFACKPGTTCPGLARVWRVTVVVG